MKYIFLSISEILLALPDQQTLWRVGQRWVSNGMLYYFVILVSYVARDVEYLNCSQRNLRSVEKDRCLHIVTLSQISGSPWIIHTTSAHYNIHEYCSIRGVTGRNLSTPTWPTDPSLLSPVFRPRYLQAV